MCKKVLYIGWCMPYDTVPHAGGQVFNYYIKKMSEKADVTLITIALPNEVNNATIDRYGVHANYIEFEKIPSIKFKKLMSLNSKFNPWHKYAHIVTSYKANAIIQKVIELKKTGYEPDIVVLQWTQTILLINEIRCLFPNNRIIAVEEDVTYLKLFREANDSHGLLGRYRNVIYHNEKRRELDALNKASLVYVNNSKDKKLLLEDGFEEDKLRVLVPYYHQSKLRRNKVSNKDILFFGNMGRPENYRAAIWFIENILPKITIDKVRFIVLGGNADRLKPYQSPKVIVPGYVEDIDTYFANSAVFVAPIVNGAGIKIKVLEAMYSGIPVITTDVGIEGIPAINRRDYYYYSSSEELITQIKKVISCPDEAAKIGINGKKLIQKYFDYELSIRSYIEELLKDVR